MDAYLYTIKGAIVPKARPRVTKHGTFMPSSYRQNQKALARAFLLQGLPQQPLKGVALSITLKGKHSRRGDADNVAGAVMDALVKAEVLENDNLICVSSLSLTLEYCKKTQPITEIVLVVS